MKIKIVSLALYLLIGGCSDDDSSGPTGSGEDDWPPAAIADLDTTLGPENQLLLRWTAPGDDGFRGTATKYGVRYVAGEGEFVWNEAQQVVGAPSPSSPGSLETMELPESFEQGGWSLAIRTADEVPNWSELSNIVSAAYPPIQFRTSTPRDGVRINTAGEDTVILDLSVTFTRPTRPGEVTFEMFPAPPRSGPVMRSVTGRNWSWLDVAMAESDSAYFWLVDGVEVLQPKVIRLVVSPTISSVGFRGSVSSRDPQQAPATGTVLFALDPTGGFDHLDPATFFDSSPLAAATTDSLGSVAESDFRFSYLSAGKDYLVIAIHDTSGDAIYDPTVDWWGYRRDQEGEPQLVPAALEVGDTYRSDVDITLNAP